MELVRILIEKIQKSLQFAQPRKWAVRTLENENKQEAKQKVWNQNLTELFLKFLKFQFKLLIICSPLIQRINPPKLLLVLLLPRWLKTVASFCLKTVLKMGSPLSNLGPTLPSFFWSHPGILMLGSTMFRYNHGQGVY